MLTAMHAIISHIFKRRRRLQAFAAVACWLLLNAQLALASHSCEPVMPSAPAMEHAHPMTAKAPVHTSVVSSALCDKHCVPDSAHAPDHSLHADALAADAGIRLPPAPREPTVAERAWDTPPDTGPPSEIVFCRFRE
ncbi:hypothetical protein AU507_07670 [Lonsdalea populi]|uniref:hypothetical protein n=2 Tax=Lonsdalea populi TaxID=1172565 RepID=UPI000DCA92A8|nr:hypothetical protein [Lonsdalea populi]RAT74346.1 hypothetical protein AU505_02220 [Lonsdalea populi]RAT78664.1 hypothetical protein AU507_07670 [Lonsdalea populi]